MRSRDGLIFPLLTFLSNTNNLTSAQYVVTVTVSVNDNPFCTPLGGVGASGVGLGNSGGVGIAPGSGSSGINGSRPLASGSGLGHLGSSGVGSGTGPVPNGR